MHDAENILAAIYRALDCINMESPPDWQLSKASETRLLGSQLVLDSMPINYEELGASLQCMVDTRNAMAAIPAVQGKLWKA